MCLHYPNMYILCKWVIGSKSAWQAWKFKCHCYSLLVVSQGKQQFVVMLIFPWFWCEQCKEELASLSSFWEADSCSSHDKLFLQRKSNHCRTYMHWIIHKHWSLDLDRSVWEQFPGCCMFADYCHLATHVPVSSAGFGCQCHQMKKHRYVFVPSWSYVIQTFVQYCRLTNLWGRHTSKWPSCMANHTSYTEEPTIIDAFSSPTARFYQ
jgi:hypothetical protein